MQMDRHKKKIIRILIGAARRQRQQFAFEYNLSKVGYSGYVISKRREKYNDLTEGIELLESLLDD